MKNVLCFLYMTGGIAAWLGSLGAARVTAAELD